jgi:hypothetical protein
MFSASCELGRVITRVAATVRISRALKATVVTMTVTSPWSGGMAGRPGPIERVQSR